MFGGEIVKILLKLQDRVQDRVQDKFGFGKFAPIFFFFLQKALKCHVWWRNCEKNPFKKNFALRKSLVQDREQEKVQDKVGLGKFSPIFFFLQKTLKCHV